MIVKLLEIENKEIGLGREWRKKMCNKAKAWKNLWERQKGGCLSWRHQHLPTQTARCSLPLLFLSLCYGSHFPPNTFFHLSIS